MRTRSRGLEYFVACYALAVVAACAFDLWANHTADPGLAAVWPILVTLPGSILVGGLPVHGDGFTAVLALVGAVQAAALLALGRMGRR